MEAPNNKGVLRLQMSSNQHYIDIETRANQTLESWDGYTITLTKDAAPVDVTFDNGVAILEAGEYTLSATNESEQYTAYSGPIYSGSVDFTIEAGKNTEVCLDLGKPKNAKVTLALSQQFAELYTISSFKMGNVELDTSKPFFFPATSTTLSYTLVANAKLGSHVQDITSASGTINISGGYHTAITLKVNPIDSNLIVIESGSDYGEEFQ